MDVPVSTRMYPYVAVQGRTKAYKGVQAYPYRTLPVRTGVPYSAVHARTGRDRVTNGIVGTYYHIIIKQRLTPAVKPG